MNKFLKWPASHNQQISSERPRENLIEIARLDPALVDFAYKYCEGITRLGSRSFYLGSRIMPLEKRRAVWALYTFCRASDDIVDEENSWESQSQNERETVALKLARLEEWERQLRRCFAGEVCPAQPGMIALADTFARYNISLQPLLDLLEGVRMDLSKHRYSTFEELEPYCYRVASTVGLIMCQIIGFREKQALDYAIKLGTAMQITNILRDVGEDSRNGRIYLPQAELRHFSYSEEELLAGENSERWKALMQFQIERARRYYREAWPGIELLDPTCQHSIRVAARLYSLILEKIEDNGYDVFTKRAYVPLYQKLLCLVNPLKANF